MSRKFTVKKQLNGPQEYRKWEDYEIGDTVIGEYVGIHHDKTYGKQHFKFKVLDCFFKHDSDKYKDKTLVLNTCGSLAKAMEDVEEGDVVQVEYLGTGTIAKGPYAGKEAHSVQVSIVEEEEEDESSSL